MDKSPIIQSLAEPAPPQPKQPFPQPKPRLRLKKFWLAVAFGLLILLTLLTSLGLYYYYDVPQIRPSLYAFASDREGNGDIFIMEANKQLRNLTQNPSADWNPIWSPDGKMVAFTSHRSGNSDIWRVSADGRTPPRNLTHHPAWDYSPTWSPSGQTLAFVSERDGDAEIFVQNIIGNTALQLTFNDTVDHLPTWSPDGKYIAFSAVRDGLERIHRIRFDGTDEQIITPQIQGTSPAWSLDSNRLAFIGWKNEEQIAIYILGTGENNLTQLYQSNGWIGSLHWSADGQWLTFTSWQSGNHEVYALPSTGCLPRRLTTNIAWDDFLVMNPIAHFTMTLEENAAQPLPTRKTASNSDVAKGISLADLSKAYLINDLGFTWGKGFVNWATVEPERGKFRWVDADNIVKALGDQKIKILMRVHGTPNWARPSGKIESYPPDDLTHFGEFMSALATRYQGQVAAYEIWNEPNLTYEWGNQSPNPTAYTAMLQTAYVAIKQADPAALVIGGGLATTGQGSPTAYGDLAFLQGMYEAGAKGYFDAFGSHAYTFGNSPDIIDPNGLSLSRVAEQHQIMQANGDGDTPIWITETGNAIKTHWDLGIHNVGGVTEEQQAETIAQIYQTVPHKWPFVKAIFLFNLDFSTVSWYPANEQMRWYAILNPDRTPRPAYIKLGRD